MTDRETKLLKLTHYGLNIYAYILTQYYPDEIVISLVGNECKPARNPFNKGLNTLRIVLKNQVFEFYDSSMQDFRGNPFQFAAKFYKLEGSELLDAIEKDLNLSLRIGKFQLIRPQIKASVVNSILAKEIKMPVYSFFRAPISNILPTQEVSVVETFKMLTSKKYQPITTRLRELENKDEARKYKATHFDYVTFSGVFEQRKESMIKILSGLMVIDFDHLSEINSFKNKLLNDNCLETELLFISPSGDGLKWIISYSSKHVSHLNFFNAVSAYIEHQYKVSIDKSGKDLSRACFIPYDPEAFIHPKYLAI